MESFAAKSIYKSFRHPGNGALEVLHDVSLQCMRGEFLGIIGPNGCGKTTLLKMMAGIAEPDSGEAKIYGKPARSAEVGYVPQQGSSSLCNWLSVEGNLAFAAKASNARTVQATLDEFSLRPYSRFYPYQLSGGLRQLASIACASLASSDSFIFDEPLGALDYQNRALVENALLKLREAGASAIMVSHDIESTVLLCDRIAVLTPKPACIKAFVSIGLPKKRMVGTRFTPEFASAAREIYYILVG